MSFGGSVKLTGESEYRKAIQNCISSLQGMSTALKNETTSFNNSDKAIKNSAAAQKQLNETIKTQQAELSKAKSAFASYQVALQNQTTKHNLLNREYKNAVTELERIKKASGENSTEYQKQAQVVDKLEKELVESTQAMNESKSAMSTLKSEINNSNKTINNAEKALNDLGNEAEDSGKQAEKGSDGFTVMKGVLANLASKAITSAISGLKKLGSAAVSVGKQAVQNYAEYEQLVGGVETLFKESSGKVQEYASKAYKTAGISANQYMEQATSFSASLLQGLGGDTEKAAQLADLAITDMADNANKMGTSIDMIQNAYQGFAKQNYTMLDNLKLGYGGTKSEMARLVKESGILGKAGKDLTAKNLDQKVSFDQIIKAINITQQRMGITGTTSKEAANTIEGSVNSMKASWSNLLTAIANDNADLGKSVDEFVESAVTAGKNLVPRVKQVVEGVKKLINSIVTEVFPKLKKEIPQLAPLIDTFQWFIDNKGLVVNAIGAMVGAFALSKVLNFTKGMSDLVKKIVETATATTVTTTATNLDTAAQVANTTAKTAGATATGLLTKATKLLNAAWKANPIGLIITGVTALIGVFGLLTNKTDEAKKAQEEQSKAIEEGAKKAEEASNAYDELRASQQKQIDAGMTEISHYESLYDELQGIVDQNGKVKKGYEERASFITSTLSNALGIEIKNVDGVIQGYNNLKSTIDQVMEKKKAQILLDSQESLYKQAIEGQTEALKELDKAEQELMTKKEERTNLEAQLIAKQEELENTHGTQAMYRIGAQILQIKEKMKTNDEDTANLEKTYNTQKGLLEKYAYDIGQYETNMALAHEGKYDEMSKVNWEYVKDYQKAGDAEKAQLQDQIKNTENNLKILKGLKEKSGSDIYNQQIKDGEKQLKQLQSQLKQYTSTTDKELDKTKVVWSDQLDKQLSEITGAKIEFKEDGKGNVQAYIDGVASGETKSKEEMASLVTATIKEITDKKGEADTAGQNLIEGVNSGIKNQNKQSGVFSSIASFGSSILSKLKASLQEHSPSKATKEMGEFLVQGLQIGIDKEAPKVEKAVKSLADKMLNSINSKTSSISSSAKNLISTFDTSISNAIKTSQTKVTNIIDNYFKNLQNENEKQQEKLQKQIDKTSNKTEKKRLEKQLKTLKSQNDEIKTIYNEFGKTAISEFSKALETATTGVTDSLQTKIQNLADTMQNEIDNVNSKISAMKTKLSDYGDLFIKVKDENGEDTLDLTNINEEIKILKKYNTNLTALKGKISDELMNEITQMSVDDAIAYSQALLNMSDKELKAYNDAYTKKLQLANNISKKFYQDKIDEIKANYTDKMKNEFSKAQKEIETIGQQTINGFIKGLKSTDYTKEVKKIANNIIKTMKKQLGIKSPSRVFKQIGEYLLQGLGIGINKEEDGVLKQINQFSKSIVDTLNDGLSENINANVISNIADSIPSEITLNNQTDSLMNDMNKQEDNYNMIEAFKTALSQMKIELDDEVAGEFVERTVTRVVYN